MRRVGRSAEGWVTGPDHGARADGRRQRRERSDPLRALTADPAFMMARQQEAPTNLGMLPGYHGETPEAAHGPGALRMPGSGFVAQLAMPNARTFDMPGNDGHMRTYVLDAANESFAVLSEDGDGWSVREGGPVSLWGEVEQSLTLWQAKGSPPATEFGVSVEPDRQLLGRVFLPSSDRFGSGAVRRAGRSGPPGLCGASRRPAGDPAWRGCCRCACPPPPRRRPVRGRSRRSTGPGPPGRAPRAPWR